MKSAAVAFVSLMLVVPAALAYQVTGPVLDVTDSKIVVEKGKEKWEIGRTPDTKVNGDLKKGARVTVQYRMTATSVDVKEEKEAKGAKKK